MKFILLSYIITFVVALQSVLLYDIACIIFLWQNNKAAYKKLNLPYIDAINETDLLHKLLTMQSSDPFNGVDIKTIKWIGPIEFIRDNENRDMSKFGRTVQAFGKKPGAYLDFYNTLTAFITSDKKLKQIDKNYLKQLVSSIKYWRIIDTISYKFDTNDDNFIKALNTYFKQEYNDYITLKRNTNIIFNNKKRFMTKKYLDRYASLKTICDNIFTKYNSYLDKVHSNNYNSEEERTKLLNLLYNEDGNYKDYKNIGAVKQKSHSKIINVLHNTEKACK